MVLTLIVSVARSKVTGVARGLFSGVCRGVFAWTVAKKRRCVAFLLARLRPLVLVKSCLSILIVYLNENPGLVYRGLPNVV